MPDSRSHLLQLRGFKRAVCTNCTIACFRRPLDAFSAPAVSHGRDPALIARTICETFVNDTSRRDETFRALDLTHTPLTLETGMGVMVPQTAS